MTDSKEFHLSVVLSMLTGKLLAANGIGDIYLICEHLSGEKGLMTHQLPRVMDEALPYLKEQFPELSKEVWPEGLETWGAIFGYMDTHLYDKYGEMVSVSPIPAEAHTYINPISELIMKKPDVQIIVAEIDGETYYGNR